MDGPPGTKKPPGRDGAGGVGRTRCGVRLYTSSSCSAMCTATSSQLRSRHVKGGVTLTSPRATAPPGGPPPCRRRESRGGRLLAVRSPDARDPGPLATRRPQACGAVTELTTERLVLRAWLPGDRETFAALNSDPVVMEHFPEILSEDRSDELVDLFQAQIEERGWGM